jgi:hypothetical protein
MEQIMGIKYTKRSGRRYVRVDLDMHDEDESLQNFLDGLKAEELKNDPTIPLCDFIRVQNKKRGLNV